MNATHSPPSRTYSSALASDGTLPSGLVRKKVSNHITKPSSASISAFNSQAKGLLAKLSSSVLVVFKESRKKGADSAGTAKS